MPDAARPGRRACPSSRRSRSSSSSCRSSSRARSTSKKSIDSYERGEALKSHCERLLKAAEGRVEKIRLGGDGKPVGTEPLDDDAPF